LLGVCVAEERGLLVLLGAWIAKDRSLLARWLLLLLLGIPKDAAACGLGGGLVVI
jgi:hypothetical protein